MKVSRYRAEFFLLLCAILWGATFVTIKSIVLESPFLLVGIRFAIAGLLYFPVFLISKNKSITGFRSGMILGLWVFAGYSFQTVGLATIDASRSAFITHILVAFTFPLQWIFMKKKPMLSSWLALIILVPGAYLLLGSSDTVSDLTGDLFTLACAFAFAMNITLIPYFQNQSTEQELIFYQMLLTSILSFTVAGIRQEPFPVLDAEFVIGMAFLAVVATLLTLFLQVRYQKQTTPARAAILFSMEPVFATVFAFILLSEVFTGIEWIGAGLILIGVLVSEITPAYLSRRNQKQNLTDKNKQDR